MTVKRPERESGQSPYLLELYLCFIRLHGEHPDYFTFKKTHVNEHTVHRLVCVPTRIINNLLNILLYQKSLAAIDIKGLPATDLI